MMFMDKQVTLLIYKLVAICTLMITLALFISVTFETQYKVNISVPVVSKSQPCDGEYVLYFGFAILLGAFINVKGLVKLGVV
jgi:hypothetical protein